MKNVDRLDILINGLKFDKKFVNKNITSKNIKIFEAVQLFMLRTGRFFVKKT